MKTFENINFNLKVNFIVLYSVVTQLIFLQILSLLQYF